MDDKLFDRLVAIRRDLHQNPELSFTEFRTAVLVETELAALGIPTERVALTGVIGTLRKGEGRTIVIRADMDALPVLEESGVSFPSKTDGVMHACGHDIHTTMLIGAATLLKTAEFSGTVKLLFQPAEEGPTRSPEKGKSGGQLIAESGKLDGADAALGLHVHPLLPVGSLSYKNGESLANVGNFSIRINGKGGHPGLMKEVIDPVAIAARLISAAHALVGPQPDPPTAVLAITHVATEAKPSFNVIPSHLLLQGSLRAVRIADYEDIVRRLNVLLDNLAAEFGGTIDLDFSAYYPSLLNDPGIHEQLSPVYEKIFGNENVTEGLAYLVGEDFSFYSRMMPAQFYFLGAKANRNDVYFLHHPKVSFNEECIKYGARFLAEGALRLLQTTTL